MATIFRDNRVRNIGPLHTILWDLSAAPKARCNSARVDTPIDPSGVSFQISVGGGAPVEINLDELSEDPLSTAEVRDLINGHASLPNDTAEVIDGKLRLSHPISIKIISNDLAFQRLGLPDFERDRNPTADSIVIPVDIMGDEIEQASVPVDVPEGANQVAVTAQCLMRGSNDAFGSFVLVWGNDADAEPPSTLVDFSMQGTVSTSSVLDDGIFYRAANPDVVSLSFPAPLVFIANVPPGATSLRVLCMKGGGLKSQPLSVQRNPPAISAQVRFGAR